MPTKKKAVKKESPVSVEFLIQTLASVQSALTSIEKESSAKTETLGELSENIMLLSEMLKNLHDQRIKDSEKLLELQSQIKILQTEIQVLNKEADIKEIKYTLQQTNSNLLELKAIESTKKDLQKGNGGKNQSKVLTFFHDLLSNLSQIKTIVIAVLLIIILITSVFFGPDAVHILIDIVKKMVS